MATHQLRTIFAATTTLVFGLVASGCVGDPDEEHLAGEPELRPELVAGAVAEERGVRILVPPAGQGVFAEAIAMDGTMQTLQLETQDDGSVMEIVAAADGAGEASRAGACSDGAYKLAGYRWNEKLRWRFKASTTPSYLSADAVEEAVRKGTANMTTSHNDCGLDDLVSATHAYDGRTSVGPNIHTDGTCGAMDGSNVVAFGDLPSGTLAIACVWYADGKVLESDIRFNKADHRWYVSKPSYCAGRFDLQGVMTHERGHSFGLAHVSESSHPALTMSESIGACDSSARTLGLGDVRAMRALY